MARNKRSRRNSSASTPFFSRDSKSPVGRLLHRIYSYLHSRLSTPLIVSTPFALLTFIISVDFSIFATGLVDRSAAEFLRSAESTRLIEEGEELKAQYLPFVYALTLFLALINYKTLMAFVKDNAHFVLILGVILMGVTYSLEPTKVITNTVIITVGTTASILLASSFLTTGNFKAVFMAIFVPMAAIHIISEYSLIASGTNPLDLLTSINRFRGITFNPNGLALSSILGVWGACGLLVSERVSIVLKTITVLMIVLFVLNILIAQSGTSLTICLAGVLLGVYLKFVQYFKTEYRIMYNLLMATIVMGAAIYITVASSSEALFSSFAGSLGKDSSLTGRTELWSMAFDAVKERPFFGYGYDSHISIKSNPTYTVPYNHYHNGYLDTLIAGGPLLLLLLLFNFSKHWKYVSGLMRTNSTAFMLVIPLMMVVIYNLSEYSLMRPHSAMWLLYVAAFSAALFASQSSGVHIKTKSSRILRRKPKAKNKEKRFRFD